MHISAFGFLKTLNELNKKKYKGKRASYGAREQSNKSKIALSWLVENK